MKCHSFALFFENGSGSPIDYFWLERNLIQNSLSIEILFIYPETRIFVFTICINIIYIYHLAFMCLQIIGYIRNIIMIGLYVEI